MKKLMAFLKGEEGLVAIEYALIGLLVAVAIVGVVTTLGTQIQTVFTSISTALGLAGA